DRLLPGQHAHLFGAQERGIRLPLPGFCGGGLRISHVYTRGKPHTLKTPLPFAFLFQKNTMLRGASVDHLKKNTSRLPAWFVMSRINLERFQPQLWRRYRAIFSLPSV